MAEKEINFDSFYFCLGNTGFRMKNFNLKVEKQLDYLEQFWNKEENQNQKWESNKELQESYYDFLKYNNFVQGDAEHKDKDARLKTAGMFELGLIDENRHLTEVGKKLLEISKSNDFSSDNFLQIPKDSFIYLTQLLKVYKRNIRPLIAFIYFLNKFDYLTNDEFTYLFPFCESKIMVNFITDKIVECRKNVTTVDDVIFQILSQKANYKLAFDKFDKATLIDKDLISKVTFNRKSGKNDDDLLKLYYALKTVYFDNQTTENNIINLYNKSNIKNTKTEWRKLLFDTSNSKSIEKEPQKHLRTNNFSNCSDENKFRFEFLKTIHLFRIKKNLKDYSDQNKRHFNITDCFLFEDETIKFDVIPKYYFSNLSNNFYDLIDKTSKTLENLETPEKICECLKFDETKILNLINKDYKTSYKDLKEALILVQQKRLERFNKLIDEKFTDENLIKILELFKKRKSPNDDKEIQNLIVEDVSGPTLFEYILAITWYKISERKGDVLSFMNLSLDTKLFPKSHASGGISDILWKYEKTDDFPKHDLMIEATLSESTNQRRMELEPVSRHLGELLLLNKDYETYSLFLTNFLHINVKSDFRNRKAYRYYSSDEKYFVDGMMIIPLETDILISVLKSKKKYSELYKIFHEHFESSLEPKEWYEKLKSTFC